MKIPASQIDSRTLNIVVKKHVESSLEDSFVVSRIIKHIDFSSIPIGDGLVFKDGKEIERITGYAPKDILKKKIDAIIA